MSSETLFLKTPPTRLFLMAAVPGAISMLASSLYQVMDGILVGQLVGATAFAAVSLVMPFVFINFALSGLIGVGSAVPIATALGRGERDEASNAFTCACLLIVLTGAAAGAVMWLLAPALMSLMGAEGEFARMAVSYVRVYALFSPVTTILYAVDNFMRICGYICGSLAANILFVALGAGLELLLLGPLGWSVEGAALAISLSMLVVSLLCFIPFFRGAATLHFCRPRPSLALVRQIVACGAPTFLNNVAGRLLSIVVNALLVRMGGAAAVSVWGVLMYADSFVQPLLYGMCDSLQPAVGYNWAARRYDRVWAIERCRFAGAAAVSVACAVVAFLLPGEVAALFLGGADAATLAMAAGATRLFSLTYLTRWVSYAAQAALLAVEMPLPASVLSVSAALVVPVALLVVLSPLGLTGVWVSFPVMSVIVELLAAGVPFALRDDLHLPQIPKRPSTCGNSNNHR